VRIGSKLRLPNADPLDQKSRLPNLTRRRPRDTSQPEGVRRRPAPAALASPTASREDPGNEDPRTGLPVLVVHGSADTFRSSAHVGTGPCVSCSVWSRPGNHRTPRIGRATAVSGHWSRGPPRSTASPRSLTDGRACALARGRHDRGRAPRSRIL
jgi:hypothetical protein